MEQALEGADAVRSVKPGRKPRTQFSEKPMVKAAVVMDCPAGYVADGDYYKPAASSASQTYAMRVWSGQSVDVPPAERKERVFAALRGQNLSTDGIIFPT